MLWCPCDAGTSPFTSATLAFLSTFRGPPGPWATEPTRRVLGQIPVWRRASLVHHLILSSIERQQWAECAWVTGEFQGEWLQSGGR